MTKKSTEEKMYFVVWAGNDDGLFECVDYASEAEAVAAAQEFLIENDHKFDKYWIVKTIRTLSTEKF